MSSFENEKTPGPLLDDVAGKPEDLKEKNEVLRLLRIVWYELTHDA